MLKDATPEAVKLLINTMRDEQAEPKLRLQCAESVLDRSLGKPSQALQIDATADVAARVEPLPLSEIREILRRVDFGDE